MPTRPRIKVCGITSLDDAKLAVRFGAHALGFIFYKKSKRAISIGAARDIVSALPPWVATVGVVVNASASEVAAIVNEVPLSVLQCHGDESEALCESYRYPYIKVIRVKHDTDIRSACATHKSAQGFLLDTHVVEFGGEGRAFDWTKIPATCSKPIMVAGGLNADNVAEAIRCIEPYGIDVCSGVEEQAGKKSQTKLAAFIKAVESI